MTPQKIKYHHRKVFFVGFSVIGGYGTFFFVVNINLYYYFKEVLRRATLYTAVLNFILSA